MGLIGRRRCKGLGAALGPVGPDSEPSLAARWRCDFGYVTHLLEPQCPLLKRCHRPHHTGCPETMPCIKLLTYSQYSRCPINQVLVTLTERWLSAGMASAICIARAFVVDNSLGEANFCVWLPRGSRSDPFLQ